MSSSEAIVIQHSLLSSASSPNSVAENFRKLSVHRDSGRLRKRDPVMDHDRTSRVHLSSWHLATLPAHLNWQR